MIDIYKLLGCAEGLSDWSVRGEAVHSYELFFVHETLETVRVTDTETAVVTVYVDHDGCRGHASFKLFSSMTEADAIEKIAAARDKALAINNEMYALPAGEVSDGEIPSSLADGEIEELAAEIARAVLTADTLEHGSINATEVFLNRHTVTVKNSRGTSRTERKYSAMVEAIPTWNDGVSVELYAAQRMGRLDAAHIRGEIEKKMREVRDRGRAAAPEAKLTCPVVLAAEELSSLCRELASGLNYASVYAHSNPFSVGDAVQKDPTGDRLTLTMRGVIEGSAASALFDESGTTLTDTEILRDGVAVSYYGSSRFGQYLGVAPSGNLPCMELAPGTLTEKELARTPHFSCVSMSGLQVDVYNDYIGGEVRLAYYRDGEREIPLSGISIAGKLSAVLSSMRLAERCESVGRYRGPAYALLSGVEIV